MSLRLSVLQRGRPARAVPAGAFGVTPEELQELGLRAHIFSSLQRPWLWGEEGPLLSGATRQRLEPFGVSVPSILERRLSSDGSTKVIVKLDEDRVEAVHMPRAIGSGRVTLCVSSQVGCAMGCTFCATASMGFGRHLAAGEIVAQVLSVLRALGPRQPGELTLVFMGMGEPLHNLSAVARAVDVLCHSLGLGLSPRRITVSTSGLVPEIAAFASLASRPLLALSLNATTDAVRSAVMPIARRYPLLELRAALERYPLRPRERITIEYVLLDGVNDSIADAVRLSDFCSSFAHQINLIPFNAHARSTFRSPSEAKIKLFARAILSRRKTVLTIRRSRGRDVQGACGQLVLG